MASAAVLLTLSPVFNARPRRFARYAQFNRGAFVVTWRCGPRRLPCYHPDRPIRPPARCRL